MNILIAPDKFKGSLSAQKVCENIGFILQKRFPEASIEFCPMADGGDGSLMVLAEQLSLKEQSCMTWDPLGRLIETKYFVRENTAFIELASASGLVLLDHKERNPLNTSTKGTGMQIRQAIEDGAKNVILLLGGSATNDAGLGIATALGFQLKGNKGELLKPIGKNLFNINEITLSSELSLKGIQFTVLCDVTNTIFGTSGAAHVFASQKGADETEIQKLDEGLRHVAKIFATQFGKDVSQLAGGGAAGAVAAGLSALLNAEIKNGFKFISEAISLEDKIRKASLVISGEGRLDDQSLNGKVVSGVNTLCQKHLKPLVIVVGENELSASELENCNFKEVFSISDMAIDFNDAMENASIYIQQIANKIEF